MKYIFYIMIICLIVLHFKNLPHLRFDLVPTWNLLYPSDPHQVYQSFDDNHSPSQMPYSRESNEIQTHYF